MAVVAGVIAGVTGAVVTGLADEVVGGLDDVGSAIFGYPIGSTKATTAKAHGAPQTSGYKGQDSSGTVTTGYAPTKRTNTPRRGGKYNQAWHNWGKPGQRWGPHYQAKSRAGRSVSRKRQGRGEITELRGRWIKQWKKFDPNARNRRVYGVWNPTQHKHKWAARWYRGLRSRY